MNWWRSLPGLVLSAENRKWKWTRIAGYAESSASVLGPVRPPHLLENSSIPVAASVPELFLVDSLTLLLTN